jgi:metal-sulfur cluster biosynthetic enzyme
VASTIIRDVQIKDEGKMRQVTIYLTVHGPLGALKLELSSEPAMSQAQIMSLLTLGEDFSSWTKEQIDEKVQSSGARMLGRWAGSLIGQQIKSRLQKIAPVDVVDIRFGGVENAAGNIVSGGGNTQTSGGQSASGTTGLSLLQDTQIDLGKYLTEDLYLNYRATLKDRGIDRGGLAWQSLVGLEYNLDASRKLKVTKDFDVDAGQELYVGIEGRTEFKGWKPSEAESNTLTGKSALKKTPAPDRK